MFSRTSLQTFLALAALFAAGLFPLASTADAQSLRFGNGMSLNLGSGRLGSGKQGSNLGGSIRRGPTSRLPSKAFDTFFRGSNNPSTGSASHAIRLRGSSGASSKIVIPDGTRTRLPSPGRRSSISVGGLARIVQAAAGISLGGRRTRPAPAPGRTECILNPEPAPVVPVEPVVGVEAPAPGSEQPSTKEGEAREHVLKARVAFEKDDFEAALEQMDIALDLVPKNGDARQFRSLILFAMKDYKPAAAEAYDAVLLGPIWTWDTIRDLYGDKGRYTEHYRQLEEAASAARDAMDVQFLLAYHHLALGHLEHGEKQLRRVLEIQPGEPVSKQLLDVVVAMQAESGQQTVSTP